MIRSPRESDSVPNAPSSPPDVPATRSSKSSSFQSSLRSDDGSFGGDISHFEDIGLDDDATITSSSQLSLHRSRAPSPSSPLPNGNGSSSSSNGGRTLAAGPRSPKPRSSFPNLRTNLQSSNPRSTSLTVLTDPARPLSPSRRTTNHSTPSLLLSHRHRSPSPSVSLNPRGPSLPQRPRRGSWQSNTRDRKSLTELEHEIDEDEDDNIPDGLILDNVPISPRPQRDRPPSRQPSVSPSPDRHKDRVRSVGNGTPAIAQAQGSLKSPTWKQDAEFAERPPPSPAKMRANSWNAGFAELNAEARALTEKLELHADEAEERSHRPSGSGRPNTWNSSQMPADYAYDRKARIKSTPELPPLRRTNVMIDPLPISKEKEAVLSRTRPSWLPPKDPAEEKRHVRQYQKMMAASAKADERREAARRSKTESRDSMADDQMQIWEGEIFPHWDDAIRERRTRELWWRGIPPRSRGLIWSRAIGNELGLSEASFTTALARAHEIEQRVMDGKATAEDTMRAKWFDDIFIDVATRTWCDLRIFDEEGPLHHGLVEVLMAYSMYRSDIGYIPGCNVSSPFPMVGESGSMESLLTYGSDRRLLLCSFSTCPARPPRSLPSPMCSIDPCLSPSTCQMLEASPQRTTLSSRPYVSSRPSSTTI